MIVNEEGKLKGMPLNFRVPGDAIVGPAVFMSRSGEEFGSLSETQVQYLITQFQKEKRESNECRKNITGA